MNFLLNVYYSIIVVMLLHAVGGLHNVNICIMIVSFNFIIFFYIPNNHTQAHLPFVHLKLLHFEDTKFDTHISPAFCNLDKLQTFTPLVYAVSFLPCA
jgi:hypothetical protein